MRSRHGQPPTRYNNPYTYRAPSRHNQYIHTEEGAAVDEYVRGRYGHSLMRIFYPDRLDLSATWCPRAHTPHVWPLYSDDIVGPMTLCVRTHGPELILEFKYGLRLRCSHLEHIQHYSSLEKEFSDVRLENPRLDWRSFVALMDRFEMGYSSWRSRSRAPSSYEFEDTEATDFKLTNDTCIIVLQCPEAHPYPSLKPAKHHRFVFTFAVPIDMVGHD